MKYIKVFGAENTGTVYLEWLIKSNLNTKILNRYDLGWKHRLAPVKDELTDEILNKVIFMCLVKNPYSWVISMYKRPYPHKSLKKLGFLDFLKSSFGDYRNPMVMWNKKNSSYLDLRDIVNYHSLVIYEEVLQDYKAFLDQLSEKFNLQKPPFYKNIHNLLASRKGMKQKSFYNEYYLKEQWKSKLKREHIEYINQFLDKQLMEEFNYSYL